ncbi:MAG: glycerol-3-phosphate dehydrogenase/oxidase [Nitrospiraceae bacterium]|nr:glycerol-3-phosphate dehydrogenase/oxidase [Nitrospiraceae bacterium]
MSDPLEVTPIHDLAVIGAGINGLGIAQDAALRGLDVVLVEQDDVCSGVSAWSGRLVHGGLRYLEQYDFGLVRESLLERERLFRLAPHLVRPVPLMMPLYRHNRRPPWMVRLGMIVYDLLSFRKTPPWHRILSRRETLERFPGLAPDGLTGAALFYDGQVELAERLCVELALDARQAGADIRTHMRADGPLTGMPAGFWCTNTLTGEREQMRARVVLNVAGPWIDRVVHADGIPDQPRLNGGTKGSHLVVDPFPGAPRDVVYYESRRDGRLVLVIPWMGRYLIGTTDIRFEDDPADARCDIGEAEYLLEEVNQLIPQANLGLGEVLFTYSGVRPLPYKPDAAESSVPRSHVLFDHDADGLPGWVTVVGGKLTTYRQLAEDAVDLVFRRLNREAPPCPTRERRLPGFRDGEPSDVSVQLVETTGMSRFTASRLTRLYGSRAGEVWRLTEADMELGDVLDPGSGLIGAEVVFALQNELAVTLTDVLARRVLVAFEPDHGLGSLDRVSTVAARCAGWSEERRQQEMAGYRSWLNHLAIPDASGPRSVSFGADPLSAD